ncbi:A/G-specific adenine glycosylase [Microlunatus speluncae]|uniref:A/G-specific adenine glycosylase n=1 Tax=Microlunatus speluncae TaxID=2594267 RepID=UPI001FEAFFB3|nr:A/G-specific adenine glycosylase [Microlunatus speluncae]
MILRWYDSNARDLPWRRPDTTPWQIMISEFMLQQTPVSRVLEPWQRWVERWPVPAALAVEPAGEAVRAWGRLGYPRRALRLHGAAVAIDRDHDGEVPDDLDTLRALPGVGDYTAAAIASFGFGQRHLVLDTNVRRVITRIAAGVQYPAVSISAAERTLAATFLPRRADRAARWAAASMELGAVVCTARSPACELCPVRDHCAWRAAGYPAWSGPPRRGQAYDGTDRQCRGAILAVLRGRDDPAPLGVLTAAWPDHDQFTRALDSLITDGLIRPCPTGFRLP